MNLKITRILHAGYIFESEDIQIIFDPIFESPFSFNCHAHPKVEFNYEEIKSLTPTAIFISHIHEDHFSLISLNLINKKTPIYIYSKNKEVLDLIQSLGFKDIFLIEIGRTYQFKNIKIHVYEALDRDMDSIFHIECGKIQVLNVVDSWIPDSTFNVIAKLNWDLILWPFQVFREIEVLCPEKLRFQNTTYPDELIQQLSLLSFKSIVPSSSQFQFERWSWLNQSFFAVTYDQFKGIIQNIKPLAEVIKLLPGKSIELNNTNTNINIDETSGVQILKTVSDLDEYFFDHQFKITSTGKIAENLPRVSDENRLGVLTFCEQILCEKISNLTMDPTDYFYSEKGWSLKIYFSSDDYVEKKFLVSANKCQKISSALDIDWITEIPAIKLINAITEGESLTSLYLRIDSCNLDPDQLDPLSDPLLRVLYREDELSFQRHQLKTLQIQKA